MKKDNQVEILYEGCETSTTITCINCGHSDILMGLDEFSSSEMFYENGWRATIHNNIYCPKCAKKKLKN